MLIGYCSCILLSGSYWLVCAALNRRKKAALTLSGDSEAVLEVSGSEKEEVADLTDKQQSHFLYTT